MFLIRLQSYIFMAILIGFGGLYAGNIQGTISDLSDNRPVHPAYITLIAIYDVLEGGPLPVEPQIYTTINNPDGTYLVENVPAGHYTLSVVNDGTLLYSTDIQIMTGEMCTTDIDLLESSEAPSIGHYREIRPVPNAGLRYSTRSALQNSRTPDGIRSMASMAF